MIKTSLKSIEGKLADKKVLTCVTDLTTNLLSHKRVSCEGAGHKRSVVQLLQVSMSFKELFVKIKYDENITFGEYKIKAPCLYASIVNTIRKAIDNHRYTIPDIT